MSTRNQRQAAKNGKPEEKSDVKVFNFDDLAYMLNGDPVKDRDMAAPPQSVVCPNCRMPHPTADGQQPLKHLTYSDMIANALTPVLEEDKRLSPSEKFKKGKLIKKILDGGPVELDIDELADIRKAVGHHYHYQAVYQIFSICDGGKPKAPPASEDLSEDESLEKEAAAVPQM